MRGGGQYPLGFPPRKLQPIAKGAGGREGGVWSRGTGISPRLGLFCSLACLYYQ